MPAGQRRDGPRLQDVEVPPVERPLDVLGRLGLVGNRGHQFGQLPRPRLVEQHSPVARRNRLLQFAARADPIAIGPHAPLGEVLAEAGHRFDDHTRLAGDGIDAERHAGDDGVDHALDHHGETEGRQARTATALAEIRPEALVERRGENAADGIEQGGLTLCAEHGVEQPGAGRRRRVLADQRRPDGDRAMAEPAVRAEHGAAKRARHLPREAICVSRVEAVTVDEPASRLQGWPQRPGGDHETGRHRKRVSMQAREARALAAGQRDVGGFAAGKENDGASHP